VQASGVEILSVCGSQLDRLEGHGPAEWRSWVCGSPAWQGRFFNLSNESQENMDKKLEKNQRQSHELKEDIIKPGNETKEMI
jgi:hypothetical protein